MSSKSKKKSPKSGAKAHQTEAEGTAPEPEAKHFTEAAEEVIHVPTGKSPLRFILTVLLVILLTAIFAIDPSVYTSRGGRATGDYFTFQHPSRGVVSYTGDQFQIEQRKIDELLGLFREPGSSSATTEQAASFLVLAAAAEAAGITVTDNELREVLQSMAASPRFGDAAALRNWMMRRTTGGIVGFQETLREQIAGQRYLEMISMLASHVDPTEVEELWREAHQEYAYDYVQLDVANMQEEAEAEAPDDATLEAWLAALPEFERNAFQEPARFRAELVGFLVDGEDTAAGLLEHFPDLSADEGEDDHPEGEDGHDHDDHEGHDHADEGDLAKRYYDRVFYFRFARPEPGEGEPALDPTDRYMPFEEVEELAAKEAPVYFALERWLAEVRRQEGEGTTVDLAQEAETLGLSYRAPDEGLSATEWGDVEGWGGPSLGARIARMEVGGVSPVLWIERGAIVVARLVEREEAYMPELADVRDRVLEGWVEERAGELALERLVALRGEFEPLPEDVDEEDAESEDTDEEEAEDEEPLPHATEEEFREAALAQGLEIRRRPYMERQMSFTMDPNKDDPGHTYIRFQAGLAQLEEGEVAEPGLNTDESLAFLVRAAGSRDPDPATMAPGEFEDARRRAGFQARFDFLDLNFGEDTLFQRFGAVFTEPPAVEE